MTPVQVRIVDENDNGLPAGEVGEVIVRGNQVMEGYLKKAEVTSKTLKGGWLHTGDLAKMDEEGFLYIVDRKKDMIISGGFNIFPREIEDALHEHPAVKDVSVIGVPHEKWGEEVKAIVVLHKDKRATAEELIKFVKKKKGSLVCPKTVDFGEAIPMTNLGKHDKKVIREKYWKGKERRVY
jgi:fatty-acyl-CoA synthase